MDNKTEISIASESLYQNLPSVDYYYHNLDGFLLSAIIIGAILFLINTAIYIQTTAQFIRKIPENFLCSIVLICGFYPIISAAAFLTILLPRSVIICNTIMHACFLISACTFHKLCFKYVNGEQNFLKELHNTPSISISVISNTDNAKTSDVLDIKTPPLCCCCVCIPKMTPTKGKLFTVRLMIYQMIMIQGLILIVLNVIYFKVDYIYSTLSMFFTPFLLSSIFTGIWGLNITVRMIRNFVPEQQILKKYLCTQLIIVFCKLQTIILEQGLGAIQIGNRTDSIQIVYKYAIIQLAILAEMFMLSIFARKAYQNPS